MKNGDERNALTQPALVGLDSDSDGKREMVGLDSDSDSEKLNEKSPLLPPSRQRDLHQIVPSTNTLTSSDSTLIHRSNTNALVPSLNEGKPVKDFTQPSVVDHRKFKERVRDDYLVHSPWVIMGFYALLSFSALIFYGILQAMAPTFLNTDAVKNSIGEVGDESAQDALFGNAAVGWSIVKEFSMLKWPLPSFAIFAFSLALAAVNEGYKIINREERHKSTLLAVMGYFFDKLKPRTEGVRARGYHIRNGLAFLLGTFVFPIGVAILQSIIDAKFNETEASVNDNACVEPLDDSIKLLFRYSGLGGSAGRVVLYFLVANVVSSAIFLATTTLPKAHGAVRNRLFDPENQNDEEASAERVDLLGANNGDQGSQSDKPTSYSQMPSIIWGQTLESLRLQRLEMLRDDNPQNQRKPESVDQVRLAYVSKAMTTLRRSAAFSPIKFQIVFGPLLDFIENLRFCELPKDRKALYFQVSTWTEVFGKLMFPEQLFFEHEVRGVVRFFTHLTNGRNDLLYHDSKLEQALEEKGVKLKAYYAVEKALFIHIKERLSLCKFDQKSELGECLFELQQAFDANMLDHVRIDFFMGGLLEFSNDPSLLLNVNKRDESASEIISSLVTVYEVYKKVVQSVQELTPGIPLEDLRSNNQGKSSASLRDPEVYGSMPDPVLLVDLDPAPIVALDDDASVPASPPKVNRKITTEEGDVFELLNDTEIGRGNFGVVKKARNIKTKEVVAVKKVYEEDQFEDERQAVHIASGTETLKQKPNIITSYGKKEDLSHSKDPDTHERTGRNKLYIFSELLNGGDGDELRVRLREEPQIFDRCYKVRPYACDLLVGLKALHFRDKFHLDFKPANFMLQRKDAVTLWKMNYPNTDENRKDSAVIIDFGCAQKSRDGDGKIRDGNGDNGYFSPQRMDLYRHAFRAGGRVDLPVPTEDKDFYFGAQEDAWALGVTLLELVLGYNPFVEGVKSLDGYNVVMPGFLGLELRMKNCDHDFFNHILQTLDDVHEEFRLTKPKVQSLLSVIKGLLIVDGNTRLTIDRAIKLLDPHEHTLRHTQKAGLV